eukprot:3864425-Amphidinium_carterae.3
MPVLLRASPGDPHLGVVARFVSIEVHSHLRISGRSTIGHKRQGARSSKTSTCLELSKHLFGQPSYAKQTCHQLQLHKDEHCKVI